MKALLFLSRSFVCVCVCVSHAHGYKTTGSSLPALHSLLRRDACEQKREARQRAEERSVFQALRSSRRRRHGLIEAMLHAGLPGPRDETGEPTLPSAFSPPFPPLPSPPTSRSLSLRESFLFRRGLELTGHLPSHPLSPLLYPQRERGGT